MTKYPGPSGQPPPTTVRAPAATASSTKVRTWSRCSALIRGPTLTSGSVPRPTFSAPSRSPSRSANSVATEACTWNRLAATQDSPMLRILATTAPSTARSRSASSNTRNGAFPPSSMDTRSSRAADCSTSFLPTSVDPVNDTLRSRGSAISGPTTRDAEVAGSTLRTPSGSPASAKIPARASMDSGVSWAGLTTMVQPAATAGPILRVPMARGKFHGVMSRHGPTGCFIVSSRPEPPGSRA